MLSKDNFESYILKSIKLKFEGKERRFLEKDVTSRFTDRPEVFATKFYEVIMLINEDINEVCKHFFHEYKVDKLIPPPASNNKFSYFISPFTMEVQEIANALNCTISRASKLKDGKIKNLYPHEVYGLAIAFGITPSSLFAYLYGDGERPLVGL